MKTRNRAAAVTVLTVFVVLTCVVAGIECARKSGPVPDVVWHPYADEWEREWKRSGQGLVFCLWADWDFVTAVHRRVFRDDEVQRELRRGSWYCVDVNVGAFSQDEYYKLISTLPIMPPDMGILVVSKHGERTSYANPTPEQMRSLLRKYRN